MADGTDRPDAATDDAAVRLGDEPAGWHPASQVLFWIGPILLYVVLPALDLRFGADGHNPPDEVMEWLENDKYYRYCTYVFMPFQYLSVILGALPVHRVEPELARLRRAAELAGQDRSGAVGRRAGRRRHQHRARDGPQEGLAGALAVQDHAGADRLRPLLHRAQPRPPRAGATPEDPASARFGETFWEFLPRSVFGSLRSSLRLEAQRIRRQGGNPWTRRPICQRRPQRLADVGGAVGVLSRSSARR